MRGSSRLRRALIACIALLLTVVVVSPPVRSVSKAMLLGLDVLPTPVDPLTLVTRAPTRAPVTLPTTEADVYRARGFARTAGIVLVHGANPAGKDDTRIVDLADSMARVGRTVLVPQLELRNERLDPLDVQRVRDAIRHLAPKGSVGVVAFSFGGALALLALAEDPAVQDDVAFVATIGTYFDLQHLVQGVTTGTVPYGGEDVTWEASPQAADILAEQVAAFLGDDGRELREAWARRDPEGLGPEARAAYDLLANRDPARVDELVEALPHHLRRDMRALSVSGVVDRIKIPVHALHDTADPAAPVTESRHLVDALGTEATYTEISIFDHVQPAEAPLRHVGDVRRLVAFGVRILRAQEGWPRL